MQLNPHAEQVAGEIPIAQDCRHFLSDRPCSFHKLSGVVCPCVHYEAVKDRILIIKLDAMGDVLRTTSILPGLAIAHPGAKIYWLTKLESEPLLRHNPYIAEIWVHGADALALIGTIKFQRIINLDSGKLSAGLAACAIGDRKEGYLMNENGWVQATNAPSREWLLMGIRDDIKRKNQRTYQSIIADILGISIGAMDYVLSLTKQEIVWSQAFLQTLGVRPGVPLVALHTGGGTRWRMKQWREEGFVKVCQILRDHCGSEVQFLLLGGPPEDATNRRIREAVEFPIFYTGEALDLRQFCAVVGQCTVLVSGDTLAMHVALALRRRVVTIFGPTSAAEIELYGRGEKIVAPLDCVCCYKMECDFTPLCMDVITPESVVAAVRRQMSLAERAMGHSESCEALCSARGLASGV